MNENAKDTLKYIVALFIAGSIISTWFIFIILCIAALIKYLNL